MGPLVRRAALRSLHDGPWTLLVLAAFTVACAAAAAIPMFATAVANAALADQITSVPAQTRAGAAPVVRLVGGEGAAGERRLAGMLDDVPGLGTRSRTAASIGAETKSWDAIYDPYVSFGGHSLRVRLFGDDGLATALVTADGRPAAQQPSDGGRQVWLPAPVVDQLGVRPGDQVQVGVRDRTHDRSTTAVVAGTYAVGGDGRLPADPPGTHLWTYRRAYVPVDSQFSVLPSYLAVTDVATAATLAGEIGDPLLFSVEAPLDPALPSLEQARRTVAAVHSLRVAVRDPNLVDGPPSLVREQVVSGLPDLVDNAQAVATQTRTWTRPLMAAGVALGLLLVTAVAVLSSMRRSTELATAATWGLPPWAVAGLAALEVLPAAAVGVVAGTALSWLAMDALGPSATIGSGPVRAGLGDAVTVAVAGCVVVAAVTGIVLWHAARLRRQHRTMTLPWEAGLVLVAATSVIALMARPDEVGHASPFDVLVPVLVVSAAGAVVGRLALALLARDRTERAQPRLRRPAAALARARAARSGRQAVLVVTVLAAGLGLLGYSLAAARSVHQLVQDRAAVIAGAGATGEVQASWLLDPGAAEMPLPDENGAVSPDPVLASRTPPLPQGTTVTWRRRANVPPDLGTIDLMVVDPRGFADAADWGAGPQLARARAATRGLVDPNRAAVDRFRSGEHGVPVPALVVGDVGLAAGQRASLVLEPGEVPIDVRATLPAYPGHDGNLGLVVVPADAFFLSLGPSDPRLRPPRGLPPNERPPVDYHTSLWSRDIDGIRAVSAQAQIEVKELTTLDQVRQQPALVAARQATGPQVAFGALVALAAGLVLVMYADRRSRHGRAADVLLARMGLGRAAVLRSRAGELAVIAVLGLVAGALGVALVTPFGARLLDPGGGVAPVFQLRPGSGGVVVLLLATLVVWLVAAGLVGLRLRQVDEAEVLRDAG
jgi:hypothetical protein